MEDLNSFAVSQERVKEVSNNFSEVIRDWLDTDQLATVRSVNRAALEAGNMAICATGDFCDSNMAMMEAMEQAGYKHYSEEEQPAYARSYELLWNMAWERSKYLGFDNGVTGHEGKFKDII